MKLKNLSIPAAAMRKEMTLLDFFEECTHWRVPGVPYVDEYERIVGRISLRDVFKRLTIPDYLIKVAHVLGDRTENIELPELKVRQMLSLPVEDYVLETIPNVSPRSSIIKALAIMEMFNSSYVFLQENDKYLGIVTRMVVARRIMDAVHTVEEGKSTEEDEEEQLTII